MSWVKSKVYLFLPLGEEGRLPAGRRADGGARCQVAKCLSTSKKPETSGARRHRVSCQLRHVATRRPLPKGALVGGTQYFFPNSLNICSLFSPKLKRAEWPRAGSRTKGETWTSPSPLHPKPPQKKPKQNKKKHFAGHAPMRKTAETRAKPEPPSKDLQSATSRTVGPKTRQNILLDFNVFLWILKTITQLNEYWPN